MNGRRRSFVVGGVVIATALLAAALIVVPQFQAKAVYLLEGCPGVWWGEQASSAASAVAQTPAEASPDECYGSQHATARLAGGKEICGSLANRARAEGWELSSDEESDAPVKGGPCAFVGQKDVGGLRSTLMTVPLNGRGARQAKAHVGVSVAVPSDPLSTRVRNVLDW